jgi:hypothetical protein
LASDTTNPVQIKNWKISANLEGIPNIIKAGLTILNIEFDQRERCLFAVRAAHRDT